MARTGRNISGFAREQRGGAAVEFALVLPVALLFLCGLLAYGIYFGAAHSVQQLAADAARASVSGLSDAERGAIATQHVAASGASYPFLRPNRLSVSAQALESDPSQFAVRVAFDSEDLPIWALAGLVPLPDKTIARVAIIKRGGY
ncbi:MAG: pilus assembly protein [Rhizobiales bacterium]|nr:pilus assembly protein [Hyphomicrobiales bacterium]